MPSTPEQECEAKTEVKGSRFIGRILPVSSRGEAKARLREIRAKYHDATHNCWAYRIIEGGVFEERFSDEGEPSGSAGKPIVESLRERDIVNALLVVTRYFGGTKLGIGGLSRAYRECARSVISLSSLAEVVDSLEFELSFSYPFEPALKNLLRKLEGTIESSSYQANVVWRVSVPKARADEFTETAGNICRGELEMKVYDND